MVLQQMMSVNSGHVIAVQKEALQQYDNFSICMVPLLIFCSNCYLDYM